MRGGVWVGLEMGLEMGRWGRWGGETERQRGGGERARDQEAEAKPLAKTAERDTERAPNTRIVR